MFRRGARVRPLRSAAWQASHALTLRDPLVNALGGARLEELARAGAMGREFHLAGEDHAPTGILWDGVNLSPMGATEETIELFGRFAAARARRASSVVGQRHAVEQLWPHLEPLWGSEVREHRWSQPLLEATQDPSAPTAAAASQVGLRAAAVDEAERVFPAAVAMFREEVGVDPLRGDGGRGYRGRVEELLRQGRTYVVLEDGEVVFKADVGARFGGTAQIHGVWVRPTHRSQGLGRAAMAALVPLVLADHAPRVALYVNDFNEPARRAYAAAGFTQVAELSTILF